MELNWTVAYYVTFDKNGGETDANPQTIKSGEGLPTTNPTRTDYKFLGWYTKDGTDGDWGEEFTADTTVSEDTTVYAKWEKLYWVTFDLNGGTADSAINPIYHGEPLPTEIPTKENFKFGGWLTNDGTNGDWGEQYSIDTVVTENITVYAKWKATDKDCLANVTLTALSGTAGANSGESYDKLVDGKKISGTDSKWCVTSFKGAEVILRASAYTIPVGYTLTTGNDNTDWNGRNPKDWVLYASNDYDENEKTVTWTEIDKVTNDTTLEDKDFKSYNFTISNTKAYKYFKLEISSVKRGDVMQLGEFELIGEGCEHTFGEPEITAPTCTTPGKTEYRCLNCDVPVINTIEATGHTLGENGICSVCNEICGAAVGDSYYVDLQEAINAALASDTDKTVTLLQDYDITETLNIGKGQVTLDLNGHTIKMTGSGSVIKLTDSGSEFILDDSSVDRAEDGITEQTGTITSSSADTDKGGGICCKTDEITIQGGI